MALYQIAFITAKRSTPGERLSTFRLCCAAHLRHQSRESSTGQITQKSVAHQRVRLISMGSGGSDDSEFQTI